MAYQTNKGTAAPVKTGMQDRIDTNIARDGAAKRPQTSFPVHSGMKSSTAYRGAAPENPGSGPDASSPNVMDPSPKAKKFGPAPIKWGMRDANGKSINDQDHAALGSAVLSEASRLGK